MVGTRPKNKTTHPAAPVMSESAKIKAGIPTTKRRKKLPMGDRIRELEARLAVYEHPDDTTPVSKEPLVSIVRNFYIANQTNYHLVHKGQ